MYDFDDVNRILAEMNDDNVIEPIDDPNIQTDFYDWADVVGVVEDFAPQVMVDENGRPWYVY